MSECVDHPDSKGGRLSTWTEHSQNAPSVDPSFFVRDLEYTPQEESAVVRILDTRLFPWILLMTLLNIDRINLSNTISDNLPVDLGFTINTENTGSLPAVIARNNDEGAGIVVIVSNTCLLVITCGTITADNEPNEHKKISAGAVMSKNREPISMLIPILMFAWGLVTLSHALIKNTAGYLTVRTCGQCMAKWLKLDSNAQVRITQPLPSNVDGSNAFEDESQKSHKIFGPRTELVKSTLGTDHSRVIKFEDLEFQVTIGLELTSRLQTALKWFRAPLPGLQSSLKPSQVIAIAEGGVVAVTLIYLSGFYKSTELATRLAWFWGIQPVKKIANAVGGLMASGLLRLHGQSGPEGWKWLFIAQPPARCYPYLVSLRHTLQHFELVPRLLKSVAYRGAVLAHDPLIRKGLTHTGVGGFKPWFNMRQAQIAVTRVIRDDISKRAYKQVPFNVLRKKYETGTAAGSQLVGWIILRAMPKSASRGVKSIGKRTLASGAGMLRIFTPSGRRRFIAPTTHRLATERFSTPDEMITMSLGIKVLFQPLKSDFSGIGKAGPPKAVTQTNVVLVYNRIAQARSTTIGKDPRTQRKAKTLPGEGFYSAKIHIGSQGRNINPSPGVRLATLCAKFVTNTLLSAKETVSLKIWVVQIYYYHRLNQRIANRYAELIEEEKRQEDDLAEKKENRSLTFSYTT
ncbi:hypothetical protein C8R43DRAFT_962953 [Mycena crocata]|nr:hypothetical protein C8R43DRAFT_962953 [Mycena crocata]